MVGFWESLHVMYLFKDVRGYRFASMHILFAFHDGMKIVGGFAFLTHRR